MRMHPFIEARADNPTVYIDLDAVLAVESVGDDEVCWVVLPAPLRYKVHGTPAGVAAMVQAHGVEKYHVPEGAKWPAHWPEHPIGVPTVTC